MNLLITGASGQLGQNISPLLSSLFSNVYELTRHDKPTMDAFKLIKADLTSDNLERKLEDDIDNDVDIVLHMAAYISKECDIDDWYQNIKTNIMGTHRLLHWSVNKKVKAFYFISTYLHLNAREQPFTIHSNLLPTTSYAVSKLINELEIANICKKNNIPYAIFRLPSFYGPKPAKIWTVLPAMIKSALLNKTIEVYGEGSRRMNFVHTNDISFAIMKALGNNTSGIFHIASKRSVSMFELAKITKKYFPEANIVKNKKPDQQDGRQFEIDITETVKLLEWEPLIDISKGIEDAILSVKSVLPTS